MRYDYRKIKTEKVEVKGIVCEFYDMRIDRATVPDGKERSFGSPGDVLPGLLSGRRD